MSRLKEADGAEDQGDGGHDQPGQRHRGVEPELDAGRRGHVVGEPGVAQVHDLVGGPPQIPHVTGDVPGLRQLVPGQVGGPGPGHRDARGQVHHEQGQVPHDRRRAAVTRGPPGTSSALPAWRAPPSPGALSFTVAPPAGASPARRRRRLLRRLRGPGSRVAAARACRHRRGGRRYPSRPGPAAACLVHGFTCPASVQHRSAGSVAVMMVMTYMTWSRRTWIRAGWGHQHCGVAHDIG